MRALTWKDGMGARSLTMFIKNLTAAAFMPPENPVSSGV
jgi:hypothetical protein